MHERCAEIVNNRFKKLNQTPQLRNILNIPYVAFFMGHALVWVFTWKIPFNLFEGSIESGAVLVLAVIEAPISFRGSKILKGFQRFQRFWGDPEDFDKIPEIAKILKGFQRF